MPIRLMRACSRLRRPVARLGRYARPTGRVPRMWLRTSGSWTTPSRCQSTSVGEVAAGELDEVLRAKGRAEGFTSIIKVYCVSSSSNYILPWQNKPLKESTGSGFVIEGRRILTNAHVIADHKFVMVRKLGSPAKVTARVLSVCHECDLAMLVVEDEDFWDETTMALPFGDIPHLQDEVTVVGFPIGGDNVSVTQGVVSRVEPQQYIHGATNLLAIQIDAAINPGNSGGPAIRDGKVIGVAFQNLQGASNIGFIIPVPIIEHFFEDSRRNNNKPLGFCSLGISCQTTENGYLQRYLGMIEPKRTLHRNGILVNKVHSFSSCANVLEKNDVVLALDGHDVACDGSVHFRPHERIGFEYLLSNKHTGDVMDIDILRKGKPMRVQAVMRPLQLLVPVVQFDVTPSYYIFAGLCFTPLTQSYLHEYGKKWYSHAPRDLVEIAINGLPKVADEEVVVLSQVLMDEVNMGYQTMTDTQVTHVNQEKIINLKHFKQMVEAAVGDFQGSDSIPDSPAPSDDAISKETPPVGRSDDNSHLVLDLADGRVIVLDIAAALNVNTVLLEQNRVPSDRSKCFDGDDILLAELTSAPGL